jgi:hypothetical protein
MVTEDEGAACSWGKGSFNAVGIPLGQRVW